MVLHFERFIVKSVAENAPDGLLSDIESHQKHGAEGARTLFNAVSRSARKRV